MKKHLCTKGTGLAVPHILVRTRRLKPLRYAFAKPTGLRFPLKVSETPIDES
jgi:hypothetical protein